MPSKPRCSGTCLLKSMFLFWWDHPWLPIRTVVDVVLKLLPRGRFGDSADWGRPEKLLRTLSERILMEQLEYKLPFRGFLALNRDQPVSLPTMCSRRRDRLLNGISPEQAIR